MAAKARSKLLQLFDDVWAVRIEVWQPALEVIHACSSTSFAVVKRPKVADLQLHGEKERFHFFIGSPDVAQAAGPCYTIEYLRHPGTNRMPSLARIARQKYSPSSVPPPTRSCIPAASGIGQFTSHKPGCRVHMEIFLPPSLQPFNRR